MVSTMGPWYRDAVTELAGPQARPGDETLRTRPERHIWSPIEYLAHVRDVVGFYDDRIRRVLAEERPALPVGDRFATLAELRAYRDDNVDDVLRVLDERATTAGQRLGAADRAGWERIGIGEGGERTVLMLARRLAHEAHHHRLDLAGPGWTQGEVTP